MNFNDTVFLQGKATFSEPRREIIFEPSDKAPRVSAPEGETIVAMPGFEITGAGIIDANFLNFGSLKTNRGTTFDAVEEIIEVRGEFTQTSSALLEISIDPNLGSPVADSIVITGGDADLDGELMISVRLDFNNPFSQIGVANKSFTLVRLDDPTGQHAITGEFSSVTAQVLDDRLGRNPIITYHDDRVEATFYCRADINRNGTIEPADFTAWISAYQQGYPLADVTNNGILNANDFTKWVELYNLGCSD